LVTAQVQDKEGGADTSESGVGGRARCRATSATHSIMGGIIAVQEGLHVEQTDNPASARLKTARINCRF
jgi:hypothetical protein